MPHVPRSLDHCHSIDDLQNLARRRLPTPIFDFLDGGSETETTARGNISAFDKVKFIPKCLVDVSSVKTAVRVLNQELAWPVFCSPTGISRFFHADGELAVARAAAAAGTMYTLSINGTCSIEEVAAATQGPKMFQLYVFRDRDILREVIKRCKQSKYDALCLAVDVPVPGKRERDLRAGFGVPIKLSMGLLASFARHPGWLLQQARRGRLSMPIPAECSRSNRLVVQTKYIGTHLDPSIEWKDVREIIDRWGGPFAVKGVMRPDDARRAADVGATAVIISNHGGRQLDGEASPLEVLPDIVKAVGDQVEVILDGGIRRGGHVLKALALGAKACSVGRAYLYGLGAGGEKGVTKAFHILRTELIRTMQLCGCTDVVNVDSSLVRRF